MVKIESYPWDFGSLTMKSMAITSNGSASGFVVIGVCYDHALLVTGYDVLLSTLQGDLSFSSSSASSFASTHAGPDHFHLIDLRLRHHALSDSCLEPPSRVLPHGQLRSFDISPPLPLDVTMTYDSDPDSNPYPFMTSSLTDPPR